MAMRSKFSRVYLAFDMVGSEDTNVSGGKSPIICLHGLTSAKESWKKILLPLATAAGRKVYAYDARNHGDSGWSDQLDYEVMGEDLHQFMNGIHCEKAILIGHSMGGKTAMYFALKRPECVEKLIVEDISPKPSSPNSISYIQKYLQSLKDAIDNIPPEMKDLMEAKNFIHEFLHKNTPQDYRSSRRSENDGSSLPLYQDKDGKFIWKTNLKVIEDVFLKSRSKSTLSGSYSGPTLMLYGTLSPYKVSADRDFIRGGFPAVQFRAIEGATHQIHEEFEDVFVKEVADFINDS